MSNFIIDTKEIDSKISIKDTSHIKQEPLMAAFMPHYVDPKSMKLMILVKREVLPGAYLRTNIKIGITCLSTPLPSGEPITIEEAFGNLNIPATLQDTIPLGRVMIDPKKSSATTELVLAQINPVELLDESRGIVYQEKGQYEIGAVEFDALLKAVQDNFIQDITIRFMLNELYILAVEEGNKQGKDGNSSFEKGGNAGGIVGAEEYGKINHTNDTEQTDNIPDDILTENADMEFGAMYKN